MASFQTVNKQEERGGTGGDTAERNLMFAILERAIEDVRGVPLMGTQSRAYRKRVAEEARAWFRSRSRDFIYDFESICDVLGLDPGAIRRNLTL